MHSLHTHSLLTEQKNHSPSKFICMFRRQQQMYVECTYNKLLRENQFRRYMACITFLRYSCVCVSSSRTNPIVLQNFNAHCTVDMNVEMSQCRLLSLATLQSRLILAFAINRTSLCRSPVDIRHTRTHRPRSQTLCDSRFGVGH